MKGNPKINQVFINHKIINKSKVANKILKTHHIEVKKTLQ